MGYRKIHSIAVQTTTYVEAMQLHTPIHWQGHQTQVHSLVTRETSPHPVRAPRDMEAKML